MLKKRIKSALENKSLQKALNSLDENTKIRRSEALENINFEEIQQQLRNLKEKSIKKLPELFKKFKENAKKAGCIVLEAKTKEQANQLIYKIAQEHDAKKIIKSKSMLTEEVGLNEYLEEKGLEITETDLGEFIIQIAKEKPSHMTVPAIHKSKEEIAELLSNFFGHEIKPTLDEIIGSVKNYMREKFINADLGITGANIAVADTGSIVLVTNEGNGRLVGTLPPVHIAVVGYDKLVSSLDDANEILKILSRNANGQKITSYVSYITGPSRTSDIEKELYIGVHGPKKVYIIFVDNHRLGLKEDEEFKELLYCLKCGACLNTCPSFLKLGGHVFGGETYTGGLGCALEYHIGNKKTALKSSKLCLACSRCEQVCPVGIKIPDLISKMRRKEGKNKITNKTVFEAMWNKKFFRPVLKVAIPNVVGAHCNAPLRSVIPSKVEGSPNNNQKLNIAIFGGCLIEEAFPHLITDLTEVLKTLGFNSYYPKNQKCCGVYHLKHGGHKYATKFIERNLKAFKDADTILTLCATCEDVLKNKIGEVNPKADIFSNKIKNFTEFIVEARHAWPLQRIVIPSAVEGSQSKNHKTSKSNITPLKTTFSKKVAVHIPCHSKTYEKLIYDFLEQAGVSYIKTNQDNSCCGFGGDFSFKFKEVSTAIFDKKFEALKDSKAEILITDCPGCMFQFKKEFKKRNCNIEVWHTVELIKELIKNTDREHFPLPKNVETKRRLVSTTLGH